MKNQFIYVVKTEKGDVKASFNIDKVIRSLELEDKTVVVILDDFNERVVERPDINPGTNKVRGYKKVRETIQSEIILLPDDGVRFFNLLNAE